MDRPSTSKPRGVCLYYNSSRGCFQGNRCKFLHGDPEQEKLTPYDKSKTCRYFASGYCKKGASCWFQHVRPDADTPGSGLSHAPPPLAPDANICGICLEVPSTFGLLTGCSHIFCLECLRNWRDLEGKSNDMLYSRVTKKCPYCRTSSKFITPSSHFYPDGHPGKAATIEAFKASTSRVPCRYFEESKPHDRFCPFGRDCLYRHMNADGTPYIFKRGVDHYMRQWRRRIRNSRESSERLFIETTVNRFLNSSFHDMNLYIEDIRAILNQSDSQNRATATPQNRHPDADSTVRGAPGESSRVEGMEALAESIIRNIALLSNGIDDLLTIPTRSPSSTIRADPQGSTNPASDNTPPEADSEAETGSRVPLRPFDLVFDPDLHPASPTSGTDSLPGLESVSDSESDSEYSEHSDGDSVEFVEHRRERVGELHTLNTVIARLGTVASAVAHGQEDSSSVDPEESHGELPNASEPPHPHPASPSHILDSQQGHDLAPMETENLLSNATSPLPERVQPSVSGHEPEHVMVSSPSTAMTHAHSVPNVRPPDSTSNQPLSAPSVESLDQDMPQRRDIEPPFMTDGRGRVVWSRSGSKTGGLHGRGRGRTGDTEDTGSGQ